MNIKNTKEIAEQLAQELPSRVYALTGELGAGKTTFAQFFLRALGVTEPITSPTFVIVKSYQLSVTRFTHAYHIDAYRLKDPHELLSLGFTDIINNPHAIVLIEWADRVRDLIPHDARWIHFQHGTRDDERMILLTS